MGYHELGRGGLKNSVKNLLAKKKSIVDILINVIHLCFKMNEKNNKNQSKTFQVQMGCFWVTLLVG